MAFLLHQLLSEAAKRFPERLAYQFRDQSISFQALEMRSDRWADWLIKQGVRRHDRVGIYMNRRLESIIAMFGIMKAGAAYVPLDPFAPPSWLATILRDCGIRHLIVEPEKDWRLRELFKEQSELQYILGTSSQSDWPVQTATWEEADTDNSLPPFVKGIGQDLACIFYTSGSTGVPKGVMHDHLGLLSVLEGERKAFAIHPSDRLSNVTPHHFAFSIFELFVGLLTGSSTVIIPENITQMPVSLAQLISLERLTIWFSVSYILIQLLERGEMESCGPTSLRCVVFGGERLPAKYLYRLMALIPGARFFNSYGMTETLSVSHYEVSSQANKVCDPLPIGQIYDHLDQAILTVDGKLASRGEMGELLLRGPSLMRGYWNNPQLTGECLVDLEYFPGYPFRYYRTRDLVYLDEDGNTFLVGRADRQVKIRGNRVNLDQVEAVLMRHEQVEDAVAFQILDNDGNQAIAIAVLTKEGAPLASSDLVNYLANRLPAYAVPAKVVRLSEFPRTPNGKVDRRKLQASLVSAEGE